MSCCMCLEKSLYEMRLVYVKTNTSSLMRFDIPCNSCSQQALRCSCAMMVMVSNHVTKFDFCVVINKTLMSLNIGRRVLQKLGNDKVLKKQILLFMYYVQLLNLHETLKAEQVYLVSTLQIYTQVASFGVENDCITVL